MSIFQVLLAEVWWGDRQCIAYTDPKTGSRTVAGVHWDFNSYGGELKKAMGIAPQVTADHNLHLFSWTLNFCLTCTLLLLRNRIVVFLTCASRATITVVRLLMKMCSRVDVQQGRAQWVCAMS